MKAQSPKGQTSFDFLMTYGWAIILVVVVVGSLFSLGVFNLNSFIGPKATGFAQLGVVSWNINPIMVLSVKLENRAGQDVRVTRMEISNTFRNYSYDIGNVSIPDSKTSDNILVGRVDLVPGQYYTILLRITYIDLNGFNYTDTGTLSGTVGVDTVTPSLRIVSPMDNAFISSRTLPVSLVSIDDYLNFTIISVYDSTGSLVNSTTNTTNGAYTVYLGVPSDGVYSITATAYDIAGNRNASSVHGITVDTSSPQIHDLMSNKTDNISRSDATLNFTVTVDDANLLSVSLNGTSMLSAGGGVHYLVSTASALGCSGDGPCELTATAADMAGNANSTNYILTVDEAPPTVSVLSPASDSIQSNQTISINFTASDPNYDYVNITVYNDTFASSVADSNLSDTVSIVVPSDGRYNITATAYDTAGNSDSSTVSNITVDTTAPSVNITAPLSDQILNNLTINVSFEAYDPNYNYTKIVIYNSTGNVTNSMNDTNQSDTIQLSVPADDIYVITATAFDLAGNPGASAVANVTVDTTAPIVSITSPSNDSILSNLTINVSFSASDLNYNYTEIDVYNATDLVNSTNDTNESDTINLSVPSDGVYEIVATAHDLAGFSTLSTASNITVTTTLPSIYLDSSNCSATLPSSGTYMLSSNMSCSGTGLNIGANGIILDCNGSTINYGSSSGYGVNLTSHSNAVIRNCVIKQNGTGVSLYGIYLATATNNILSRNNITTNGNTSYDIYLSSNSNLNAITGNIVTTNGTTAYGIYLSSSSNNNLTNNNITTNNTNGVGVYFSSSNSNLIANNNITTNGSGARAIWFASSSYSNITGNQFNTYNAPAMYFNPTTTAAYYNHTIDTTNTKFGKPIYYYFGNSSTAIANLYDIGQLYVADCTNVTVSNITVINDNGITLALTNDSTVANSSIRTTASSDYGIYLQSSLNTTLANNTITTNGSNAYGIYLSGANYSNIMNNNITTNGSTGRGIWLEFNSNNIFSGNNNIITYGTTAYGISLQSSSNNNIFSGNNTITTYGSTAYGVYLAGNSNVFSVTNNITTYNSNSYGIYLYNSSNNTFSGNSTITVNGTTSYGIDLNAGSNNNTFSGNNTIVTNGTTAYGILLQSSSNNIFSGTSIISTNGTTAYGIYVYSSSNNNTIINNTITSLQSYAAYLASSTNNTIYNNILNGSSSPVSVDANLNYWNTTLSCDVPGVTNIIGGNCTGGNFWATSSATGWSQTCTFNSSGLCNASYTINSNNIDYLPLTRLTPPPGRCGILNQPNTVYNMTQSVGSLGTCFTIAANNVTLNCNGSTIGYSQSSNGYAINITGYNYTTIKNCNIVQANSSVLNAYAIYLSNAKYSNVTNNNISTKGANEYGMLLNSSSNNNTLTDNNITTNGVNSTSGGNYGIYLISSSYNNLTSNRISTNGSSADYGICLNSSSSNNKLSSNNITTNSTGNVASSNYGIYLLSSSSNNNVTSNRISTNGSSNNYGIYLSSSSGNGLTGNNITTNGNGLSGSSSNDYGIALSSSPNNAITYNNISVNGTSGNRGFYIVGSTNNNFTNNAISKNQGETALYIVSISTSDTLADYRNNIDTTNTVNGLPIDYYDGVYRPCPNNTALNLGSSYSVLGLISCTNVNVTATNNFDTVRLAFTNNSRITGMNLDYIHLSSSSNNTITSNNITGVGVWLVSNSNNNSIMDNTISTTAATSHGFYLGSNSNNTLAGNNITTTGSNSAGILLNPSSSNNLFTNNTINTNDTTAYGIEMMSSSNNNNLTGNNITTNGASASGIFLQITSNNNTLANNSITTKGTTAYGIYLTGSSNITNVSNNRINTNGTTAHGVYLLNSSTNALTSNNITTNSSGAHGVDLNSSANNNSLTNNFIISKGAYAADIASSSGNLLYNNLLNGSSSYAPAYSNATSNYWNSSDEGNYYADSAGTGFSQTSCTDRGDGICSTTYTIPGSGSNVDSLPLAIWPH